MPSTYAHYRFGQEVLKEFSNFLPIDCAIIIHFLFIVKGRRVVVQSFTTPQKTPLPQD